MKILCVIDSLGSGGAQRQMVNLACGLKTRGHDVELLVYFPQFRFFRPEIDAAGIFVHEVEKKPGFSWLVVSRIYQLIRSRTFDAVISFLRAPNIYCEIAKLFVPNGPTLIVSERLSALGESDYIAPAFAYLMHVIADFVVANSHNQVLWLSRYWWLRKKTRTVYNGYSITPRNPNLSESRYSDHINYVVIGRIGKQKNGLCLIKALILYAQKHGRTPIVAWVGRQDPDSESLTIRKEMDNLLEQHPEVAVNWQWLGERSDIPELLQRCDALLHVSLYEGLPNVVCEAFIESRPVIISNVCDHPLLVEEGVRGFLCNPLSHVSICEAIERFESLSDHDKEIMGANARHYAEKYLTIDRMVIDYEDIINSN